MTRKFLTILTLSAFVLLSALAIACGDDDDGGGGSEEDRQEVIDVATRLASASAANQEDVDYYVEHATDNFVTIFFPLGIDQCAENAEDCIGEPLSNPVVDEDSLTIDGDTATATVNSDDGDFVIKLAKEDGVWKGDGLVAESDEIPDGVEAVELGLVDFAFNFDAESEALKSGTFAFEITNLGSQVHEAALAKIPEEGEVVDILQSDDAEVEFIGVKIPFSSGDEANWAVPQLDPGRYALVCFLPDTNDPEFTPHAFKGMAAEFTVE